MKYFYLSLIFLSLLGISLLGVAGNLENIKIYRNVTEIKVPRGKSPLNLDQPREMNLDLNGDQLIKGLIKRRVSFRGIDFEYFVLGDETVVRELFGIDLNLSGVRFGEINLQRATKSNKAFKFVGNFTEGDFYDVQFPFD